VIHTVPDYVFNQFSRTLSGTSMTFAHNVPNTPNTPRNIISVFHLGGMSVHNSQYVCANTRLSWDSLVMLLT
jgi:hypothetical protein